MAFICGIPNTGFGLKTFILNGASSGVEKAFAGLIPSGNRLIQDGLIPSFVLSAKNIFLRIGSRPKAIKTTIQKSLKQKPFLVSEYRKSSLPVTGEGKEFLNCSGTDEIRAPRRIPLQTWKGHGQVGL